MEKCPEKIEKRDISLVNRGGRRKKYGLKKLKWHSEEDRIRAATVYAATGSCVRTSEITSIPAGTIRQWRTQEWWPQIIDRIQSEEDDELDVKFTNIVKKSVDQINERIDNGDFFFDQKAGEAVKVPVKAKDLGVIASIFMDKRDLIRRKAKSNVEEASTRELLNQIANTVRDFVKNTKQKTIDGEVTRVDTGIETSRGFEGHGSLAEVECANEAGEFPPGGNRESQEESGDAVSQVEDGGSGGSEGKG